MTFHPRYYRREKEIEKKIQSSRKRTDFLNAPSVSYLSEKFYLQTSVLRKSHEA